jgi:hypothetical protein
LSLERLSRLHPMNSRARVGKLLMNSHTFHGDFNIQGSWRIPDEPKPCSSRRTGEQGFGVFFGGLKRPRTVSL